MDALFVAFLALLGVVLAAVAAWLAWRSADEGSRRLVKRVARLRWRAKLRLALALARDRRIPLVLRALPPALILYLAMPLDVVPDFIPVLGQLDDLLIVGAGVALLLRLTPREVLEEHVRALEDG
ncbi:MAG TPA: DUF1232 domain-containing protein [Dehalococcoidia bacterium]